MLDRAEGVAHVMLSIDGGQTHLLSPPGSDSSSPNSPSSRPTRNIPIIIKRHNTRPTAGRVHPHLPEPAEPMEKSSPLSYILTVVFGELVGVRRIPLSNETTILTNFG